MLFPKKLFNTDEPCELITALKPDKFIPPLFVESGWLSSTAPLGAIPIRNLSSAGCDVILVSKYHLPLLTAIVEET